MFAHGEREEVGAGLLDKANLLAEINGRFNNWSYISRQTKKPPWFQTETHKTEPRGEEPLYRWATFIHRLPLSPFQDVGGHWSQTQKSRANGGVHPGRFTSPSQGYIKRQTFTLTPTVSINQLVPYWACFLRTSDLLAVKERSTGNRTCSPVISLL